MRKRGIILLFAGFIWLTYDVAIGFTEYQYTAWLVYCKLTLPEGDPVSRHDATDGVRELCLDLKDRHAIIILPAIMMLVGGLMFGGGSRGESVLPATDDRRNDAVREASRD